MRYFKKKTLATGLAASLLSLSLTLAPVPYASLAAELTDRDVAVATLENSQLITLNGTTAETSAQGVTVSDGQVTITQAGTYALTGSFNGQVAVSLAEKGEVNLLFNGVSIQAETGAALSSAGTGKTVITLADGTENALVSGGEDTAQEETAALVSRDDLTINGTGSLNVTAGKDGIASKDSLVLVSGTYVINAESDGLKANDQAVIAGGNVTVTAGDDAIVSDTTLEVTGGTITVSAADDGLHSDDGLTITGGEINVIQSEEGIEGVNMTIAGGVISVVSSDDAINAAGGEVTSSTSSRGGMQSTSSGNLTISGGQIVINSEGDGIDANGSITMTGGEVYIAGPSRQDNGALDYDDTFTLTGGTLVALDNGGMTTTPSSTEVSGGMVSIQGSSTFQVSNASGTLISFAPGKSYTTAVVYSDQLTQGETYTVTSDGGTASLTASTETGAMHGGPGMPGGWQQHGGPGMNGQDSGMTGDPRQHGQGWGQQPGGVDRHGPPQGNSPFGNHQSNGQNW